MAGQVLWDLSTDRDIWDNASQWLTQTQSPGFLTAPEMRRQLLQGLTAVVI